jgi:hypothetical protein
MNSASRKRQERRERQREGLVRIQPIVPAGFANVLVGHGFLAEGETENREAITAAVERLMEDLCRSCRTIPMILQDRLARPWKQKQRQTYKPMRQDPHQDKKLGWALLIPRPKRTARNG